MTNIITLIVTAIVAVETPCGRFVGDGGRAIGRTQVHRIMVREVNRLTGSSHRTTVAYRKAHSEKICHDFVAWALGHGWSVYEIAQAWNGGISAPRQGRSRRYANKVMQKYNQLRRRSCG